MDIEELITEIGKQTNLSRKELMDRIEKKCKELDNLITKEGAAYLIAKEFGINFTGKSIRLQIKNIVPGMRNINVIGRVLKISSVNEFERQDGSKGKVVNIFLSDGSAYVRLPLWDDQTKIVEEEMLKLGDLVQITNGLARENIFGDVEISLGRFGSIRHIEDSLEIPSFEELSKKFLTFSERTCIKDIVPGNFEIKATIVNVFKGNFLFDVCSICGSTLNEGRCLEHGSVESNPNLVISCIADDGTGDLRVVFFREIAEKVCGISSLDLIHVDVEKRFEIIKEKLLGRELLIEGRVRKNKMFDRLEMIVNDFKDLNVLEEIKRLVEEVESKIGG